MVTLQVFHTEELFSSQQSASSIANSRVAFRRRMERDEMAAVFFLSFRGLCLGLSRRPMDRGPGLSERYSVGIGVPCDSLRSVGLCRLELETG